MNTLYIFKSVVNFSNFIHKTIIVYVSSVSIFLSTYEMKKSSYSFSTTQIAPTFIWGLKKRIYFSILNVGKKVSSFWGIDCESLTD